jgi:DNA-binding NarL/FixJ family response regulator
MELDMAEPIRIAIADDHALFRQGLRLLLELHDDIKVVGDTDRVDEVMPLLDRTPCDILLLDLQMDRSSMTDIKAFAKRARVIVVTASEIPDHAIEALRAGASGIILKRFASETLTEAIHAVAAGRVWTPPSLAADLAAEVRGCNEAVLTARELQVVRYVARGLRNAEVARHLFISEQTVKAHLNNIFQKIGVRDRVELALYALRRGIVTAQETGT